MWLIMTECNGNMAALSMRHNVVTRGVDAFAELFQKGVHDAAAGCPYLLSLLHARLLAPHPTPCGPVLLLGLNHMLPEVCSWSDLR